MDTSIRSLLIAAQKIVGQDKNPALLQAYSLLRNVAESKPAVDTPESFSPDLYVLCAEIAFQNGLLDMAKECLKMYFMKPPPGNQFLCRAYLCQAQLLAPTATNPEQLEKAVVYLLKAISFAKENQRYHFLVYNASVIYWQFCRPFLKQNFRQYLTPSLHSVVKALDDIDDKDYEWRAQLMIALIECNLDGGKKTDASQIAVTASTFIKQYVPHLYKQVFGLIVRNQLMDSSKLHKDVKNSPELAVFYQICKLKVSLENSEAKEYHSEIQRILNQMGVAHSERKSKKRVQSPAPSITEGDRSTSGTGSRSRRASVISLGTSRGGTSNPHATVSREVTRLSRDMTDLSLPESLRDSLAGKAKSLSPDNRKTLARQNSNGKLKPSPEVRKLLGPEKSEDKLKPQSRSQSRSPARKSPMEAWGTKSPGGVIVPAPDSRKSKTSTPDQKSRKSKGKESERGKSPTKGAGRRTPTPVSVKKIGTESPEKPFLLLELARLCLELDFPDLAQDCADHMKTCNVKEQGFYLELEFLGCEVMVKNLSEKQESLHKNIVDIRLQAIKRCEEAIMNAIRLGDPNVIQVGCVTQWNLCLPLLQPNLRRYVRKPLTQVTEALENIQSLLVQLRCQIHTELSKCEEDEEQIQVAMEHLRKALALDDGQIYKERLEVMLHRLELRSELYKQPERPEDIAGMIIEQARKANSGTMRMKRSLLVKAGEALAPDAFLLVLDSESDTKDVTGGKAPLTVIKKLSNKARQYIKCVKKAKGHLQRLGDENDRERARLWGDLAKTARKQEVWDVCRVAARFCLLYDDGRWKNVLPEKVEGSPKPLEKGKTSDSTQLEGSQSTIEKQPSQLSVGMSGTTLTGSRPASPTPIVPLYDKDLIRMLAEVNFIQGEAMVHLMRTEGVQLNDMPIPPVDKSRHPKGYVAKKPEEDPDWLEYCDWIKSLSESSTNSFLRGLDLGVELEEAWLVCCATAYIWNYNNHILTQLRHREILPTLTAVFNGLKKVGHAGETMALVNICNALSYALMKPWIPVPASKDPTPASSPTPADSPAGKKKDPKAQKNKSTTGLVSISPDATPDLKQAIEVCEYAMEVTGGSNPQDVVPIQIRQPILQTWVSAKQMAQQQITRNLGIEEEPFTEGQKPMSRSIVAMEMMTLNKNGIMEFKEVPTLPEVAAMLEECKWTDKFVELQLWTRLTSLAYDQKMHNLVIRCSKRALRFSTVGTQPKNRQQDKHHYIVEQEMLSYASGILGQSLVENMGGKNAIRREALEAFLKSARFAANADNYEMVMTAARHYWNACCPLVSQPIERELLREPIRIILECITATAEKLKKKEEKTEEADKTQGESGTGGVEGEQPKEEPEKSVGGIGAVEDDLTLRAALYGVLFQSYADKREWEEGLKAMDQAITDMPRTKHRLLIFKHRVMTKAKLGRSVAMDIQKFKHELRFMKLKNHQNWQDESEDYVAHMWRRVALSSKETAEQLLSYQNAIEALNSESNEWLKVELLIEFGQFLCVKDFPVEDAVDQLEWAIDIMLNMQVQADAKKEEEMKAAVAAAEAKKAAAKGGGKKDKRGAPPPKPQKPPSAKKEEPQPEQKDPAGKVQQEKSVGKKSDGKTPDIDAEGYIPVVKEAVIGVLPAKPDQKVDDISDIKILDGLIRAHVLIAEIIGRSSRYYADYLLMAHAYLMRLWKVTVPVTGPTMKEIAKNPPAPVDAKEAKGSAKKKGDKGAEKAPVKEKPKRKGPLDVLPHNTEEWAVYDVPDEVIEAFKHEFMTDSGINSHTIVKPLLTLYYLDSLVQQLRDIGYNHLTLPVLAFEDLLSRDLLPSEALKFLVHTRALEVCLELNLKNGYQFHEKLNGQVVISENNQAMSRDEIAMWKEKQAQVIKEEMRVKETIAKMAAESKSSSKTMKLPTTATTSVSESEVKIESHLGKVLGAVTFRDVWTDTAEILIRQGHYQSAREFLNEANIAAQSFEDVPLQARILYLLGMLSYEEAQYGQVVNLCKKAQALYHGDEEFWYDTTMLMVNATILDYENRNAKKVARGILVHSLNEFTRIMEERPNRSGHIGHVIAMLEYKLASTQWSIITEENSDLNEPKVMQRVDQVCEKFDDATMKILQLGFKREALPIMKEHAGILHKMAAVALEKEIRHTYYLQSMMVLCEAVSVAEDVMQNIQTLYTLQEMRQMSLPIQREVADIKIKYGDMMLEVFHVHAKEARNKQLEDQRKGSVLKMVEDFIRATPDYTHMEKEWEETVKVAIEDAVMKFVDAHNLAGSIPNLKAKALCGVGQCLRALSTHKNPDPPVQWIVQEMELAKISHDAEEGEAEDDEDLDPHSRHFLKYAKQIREMKGSDEVSRHYLVQAVECLVQALTMSLQKKYVDIAARASLELVECFGQFDPATSSQFLALFQSCNTSLRLEDLLNKAQLDPIQSKLAALLRQRSNLLARDITLNTSSSSVVATVQNVLENDWQAWKKMEVLPTHLDLLKEFPSNFNFIILQHSPDKNFLYGAVLDRPKGSVGSSSDKKNPKTSAPAPSRAKVFGVETSPAELAGVLEKCREHKQNVQQLLLKQEYQRSQAAMRQKMLENLDDSIKGRKSKMLVDESEEEERQLQDEFRDVVMSVEMYLKPLLMHIDEVFLPTSSSPATTSTEKPAGKEGKEKEPPPPPQEYAILLADPDLMELPLEAMRALSAESIVSLSRDFSLQLFYHRYHQELVQGEDPAAAAKKAKAKGADQPFSRIPGLRDASKKMAKIIPLNRPLNAYSQGVDTMNFRFIVDPHLDCAETEENKPIVVFNKVLEQYEQQFTPRWLGVMGDEHAPSIGEWEIYLIENSSFIFYGMEKLLSYLPPHKLSALNIPECMIVYLLDMAQTTKSFTRQSKVDVLKSSKSLALEKPVETAMLTSLTGVKCIIENQWHCTLAENASKLNSTMEDLLNGGMSTGEALRLLFAPYRRKLPASEEAGEGEDGKSEAGKSQEGSQRADSVTDGSQLSGRTETSEQEYKENIDLQRSWFNLVCYGLPNLVVTQM